MITEQLQKKIDRSIRLLQSVANGYDGEIEVAYSGGKDSDVILQLAKEAGIKYRAIYKNTTIDPPGTIKHVREMGVEVMQPKESFFKLIARKGFPSRMVRHCCQVLKEYKTPGMEKCIIGVRKSESRARKERYNEPTACLGSKKSPYEAIYPILDWTDEDVREFILDRNIKCAPVYYDADGTFHVEQRLGCMGCPLIYYKKRIEQFKEHPQMVKGYLRAGQKYMDSHPNAKRVTDNDNNVHQWFVRELYFNSNVEWFAHLSSCNLFGKPDYKSFLEKQFDIDLTL